MQFSFAPEQLQFADSFRQLYARHWSVEKLRERWRGDRDGERALWDELHQIGAVAAMVPESSHGLGLDPRDMILLLEETGYAMATIPFAETAFVAAGALKSLPDSPLSGWLEKIGGSGSPITVSHTREPLAAYADQCDAVLVSEPGRLRLAAAAPDDLRRESALDRSRPLFQAPHEASTDEFLSDEETAQLAYRLIGRFGAVAAAAELNGLCRRLIEFAVGYARQRRQFGRPIGAFQAVQHSLADAMLAVEFSRPVTYAAAAALAQSPDSAKLECAHAKARASMTAMKVSDIVLQVHGAIGYTTELDLHMWLKRAKTLSLAWGTAAAHLSDASELLLGIDERVGCWE